MASSAVSPTVSKFATRDFSGKARRYLRVEATVHAKNPDAAPPKVSEEIVIVDRSGSMYGTIDEVKSTIEKLFTLNEFANPNFRVSLISYSSRGDVKLHFDRVTVKEIMAADSPFLKEIRAIRATSMTCISQALSLAATLLTPGRTTGIVLHTDGCANDPYPAAESKSIATAVEALRKPGVFCNTVGYGSWCDTTMLMNVANTLSGRFLRVSGIREMYDALHDTTRLLTGEMAPVIEVPIGKASFVAAVSRSGRKVLGGRATLAISGLGGGDDLTEYRYFELSEAEYEALNAPIVARTSDPEPILAYARAKLSAGAVSEAKFALVAALQPELLNRYARALVASDLASFAEGVERAIYEGAREPLAMTYGLPTRGPSELAVLNAISAYAGSLEIDLEALTSTYRRRGLKKVAGVRNEAGELVPPKVEGRAVRSPDGFAKIAKIELNRNSANANILIVGEQELYRDGKKVASVAGVSIDRLPTFNNYTLVGDGARTVDSLRLRVSSKLAHRALAELGAIPSTPYEPGEVVEVDFREMPLTDYAASYEAPTPAEYENLVRLTVVSRMFEATMKGGSTSLTAEQLAALDELHLSAKLNFSPPTTNEYTDLAEAISTGKVDSRTSYRIDFGSPKLTRAANLGSANAFLKRRFTLSLGGKDIESPKYTERFSPDAKFEVKKLTGRTKLSYEDEVSFPLHAAYLGLGDAAVLDSLLESVGVEPGFVARLSKADAEGALILVEEALSKVSDGIDAFYAKVRPLAFYVGATGLLPETLEVPALTADEIAAKYPEAKLSAAEKEEGIFYLLPNGTLLTVYAKTEYFTV